MGTEYKAQLQEQELGCLVDLSSSFCFVTHPLCDPEKLTKFSELHFLILKMQLAVFIRWKVKMRSWE